MNFLLDMISPILVRFGLKIKRLILWFAYVTLGDSALIRREYDLEWIYDRSISNKIAFIPAAHNPVDFQHLFSHIEKWVEDWTTSFKGEVSPNKIDPQAVAGVNEIIIWSK